MSPGAPTNMRPVMKWGLLVYPGLVRSVFVHTAVTFPQPIGRRLLVFYSPELCTLEAPRFVRIPRLL